MRKTRVKKLKKELISVLGYDYSLEKLTPNLWRNYKRNYVKGR